MEKARRFTDVKEEQTLFSYKYCKWPDIGKEAKNWVTDHRNNRNSVSTKIIIF
jgi:hypothetical protein